MYPDMLFLGPGAKIIPKNGIQRKSPEGKAICVAKRGGEKAISQGNDFKYDK